MKSPIQSLQVQPIIAAVRDASGVARATRSNACCVFLLGGSILTLPDMAKAVRDSGKWVFIHMDLLDGLGHDAAAVEWCALHAQPDGLISTRAPLLKKARECSLMTIQRIFVMDSSSLHSGTRLLNTVKPDMVELLPGLIPKAIHALNQSVSHSVVIAGGMVTEKDEVRRALDAGALAVSSSDSALWDLTRSQVYE